MMAQMELIHKGCGGELSLVIPKPPDRPDSYMCQKCLTYFTDSDKGMVFWYKLHSVTYGPDGFVEHTGELGERIDISQLAREISCEGRVM